MRKWIRFLTASVALLALSGCANTFVKCVYYNGFIVCVFDKPSTLINHGSKLVFGVRNPMTHEWVSPVNSTWTLDYVRAARVYPESVSGTEVIGKDDTLVVARPVTIALGNAKGGEIDVEFTVLPRSITQTNKRPWR